MPRAKRARLTPRPPCGPSAAAAADPGLSRGWLSVGRDPSDKPPRRPEDDGTPLSDEILLVIFAGFPDLADLVRCAFTCRRWRRLVSGEAAFLCRTPRRLGGKFIPGLALGFFHHLDEGAAAPRFVPLPSAVRRLGFQVQPSLTTLVEGLDGADGLFNSSRIVASRNGLLVVDLRHGKKDRALKLCVFNPMTGDVHILPPLSGKDGLGHFACTVITAEYQDNMNTDAAPARSSYFRLLLLYTRRGFTAFRSYSSDEGSWSEEAKVTNARLGKKQMGLTHMGVADHGDDLAYWLAKNVVFVLSLKTMASKVIHMPHSGNGWKFDMVNTLLGFSPEGNHCAVQFAPLSLMKTKRDVTICVSTSRPHRGYDTKELFPVEQFLPANVMQVNLRWFCEKSGVVFFSAVCGSLRDRRREMYALNLNTRTVEMVASHAGDSDPWKDLYGYEMDQVAYLASLAERDVTENMRISSRHIGSRRLSQSGINPNFGGVAKCFMAEMASFHSEEFYGRPK
ncbi:hypothetical protein EJB05_09335, partial [Eragrostis curvula]